MNDVIDPVSQQISPLHQMSNQAKPTEVDHRDQFFGSDNEQTYAAPSAPVISPPLEDSDETQSNRRENEQKTQSLGPLL